MASTVAETETETETETKAAVEERVRAFLGQYFRNREVGADEDIFALGFVNSLVAMQLVQFVEKEFRIEVEDEDLDLDNFRSIGRIVDLVVRKRAGAASSGAASSGAVSSGASSGADGG